MPVATHPEWQQLALYAVGAAVLLTVLFAIPRLGAVIRGLFSVAILAFGFFVLLQQAPFNPELAQLTARLGFDDQQVVGQEVRIRMSRDGHFWARATINGVERRMLVDSGATVTALSAQTADAAGVKRNSSLVPVLMRTANGVVKADTGSVESLNLGGAEARNLKVVISPSLGPVDVLGMNFLSQLASWRVEGRTLVLLPEVPGEAGEHPTAPDGDRKRTPIAPDRS
jgi:aspartyl protease family protein